LPVKRSLWIVNVRLTFGSVATDCKTDKDTVLCRYTFLVSEAKGGDGSSYKIFESYAYEFAACIFNLDPCGEKIIYIGVNANLICP